MNQRVTPRPPWEDKPRKPAWVPVNMTTKDIEAIRACWDGKATPEQQRHVLDFTILAACQYTELSFRSDRDGGERETAFAQGRWFVGQTLVKALNLPAAFIAKLRKEEHAGRNSGSTDATPTRSRHARAGE